MTALTDQSLMKFGKYKNRKLADVPAEYLLWIYDNLSNIDLDLREYIKINKSTLEQEYKIAEELKKRNSINRNQI